MSDSPVFEVATLSRCFRFVRKSDCQLICRRPLPTWANGVFMILSFHCLPKPIRYIHELWKHNDGMFIAFATITKGISASDPLLGFEVQREDIEIGLRDAGHDIESINVLLGDPVPGQLSTPYIDRAIAVPGPNDERDKFIYEQCRLGKSNKEIRSAIKVHGGWDAVSTDQAINAALTRYCENHGLEKPVRHKQPPTKRD